MKIKLDGFYLKNMCYVCGLRHWVKEEVNYTVEPCCDICRRVVDGNKRRTL